MTIALIIHESGKMEMIDINCVKNIPVRGVFACAHEAHSDDKRQDSSVVSDNGFVCDFPNMRTFNLHYRDPHLSDWSSGGFINTPDTCICVVPPTRTIYECNYRKKNLMSLALLDCTCESVYCNFQEKWCVPKKHYGIFCVTKTQYLTSDVKGNLCGRGECDINGDDVEFIKKHLVKKLNKNVKNLRENRKGFLVDQSVFDIDWVKNTMSNETSCSCCVM